MESKGLDRVYKYTFAGGDFNSYYFTTVDNLTYEIKFVPSSDFFDAYPDLGVDVFEMVISVADNPTGGRLKADSSVAPTIFAIFEAFFLPHQHAIVFICDSSDGRQLVRHRKFGAWFYNKTATNDLIAKIDRKITDGDQIIMLSLLMNRLHPQLRRIVDMFMFLGEEEK
ncbi:MAG: hypothetical protein H7Z72_18445 [Bacteroidetes bacterium]|nr:hypothetical protein [Fibrella sp.]